MKKRGILVISFLVILAVLPIVSGSFECPGDNNGYANEYFFHGEMILVLLGIMVQIIVSQLKEEILAV